MLPTSDNNELLELYGTLIRLLLPTCEAHPTCIFRKSTRPLSVTLLSQCYSFKIEQKCPAFFNRNETRWWGNILTGLAEFISGGEIPKAFVVCWLAMIVSMTFWLLCTMNSIVGVFELLLSNQCRCCES